MTSRNNDRRSGDLDRELFEKAFPASDTGRKGQVLVFSPDTAVPANSGYAEQSLELSAWEAIGEDYEESKSRLTCHVFPNSLEGVVAKLTAQIELFSGSITQSALYRRISASGIDTLRMNKEVKQLRRTLAIARKKLSADELGLISNPSEYGLGQRYWQGQRRQNIPIFDSYLEKALRLNKDLGISQSMFAVIAVLAAVSQSRWERLTDARHYATIELEEFFELHVGRVERRYKESLKTLD